MKGASWTARLVAAGLCVVAWTAVRADPACARPLRVGFDDAPVPPALVAASASGDQDWNALVAREVAIRLGCAVQEVHVPARRLEAMAERGDVDFAFLFGPTPERLRRLRFPLGADGRPDPAYALVMGRLALFALRGDERRVGWDGHAPRAGARIGAVSGTIQAGIAQARGWDVEPIANPVSGVPMLRGHRFDALFTTRETLPDDALEGPQALVELMPEVEQVFYYAVASPAMQARDPALTRRYWQGLCEGSRRYFSRGLPACPR